MNKEHSLASDQVLISEKGCLVPALITVAGSLIKKVSPCTPDKYREKLKEWKQRIPDLRDYSGFVITPGFINAHTHIAMNLFRGLDSGTSTRGNMIEDLFYHVESHLSREDILAFARAGAMENLLSGNLMVWDHYYHGDAVAKALLETGLTGVVAPTLQDLLGPGKDSHESAWEHTLQIHGSEDMKNHGIFAAFGPHATDTVSEKLWLSVLESARNLSLPVHSHHAQSGEEYQRSLAEKGVTPGQWLNRLGAFDGRVNHTLVHNIFLKQQDLLLYQKPGVTLVFCPFSALVFAIPARITDWEKHGLRFGLGTDCVASNDSMNLQKELRYLSGFPVSETSFSAEYQNFLEAPGESPAEAVTTFRQRIWDKTLAFREPRWLLSRLWEVPGSMHPGFQAGTLKEDALANLLVWDREHPSLWPFSGLKNLAMGDSTQAIHNAMSGGCWLGQDGDFHRSLMTSRNYGEISTEANNRFRSLLKRCGL